MQSVPAKLIKVSQRLAVIAELATRPDPSFNIQGFVADVKQDLLREQSERVT